MGAEIFVFFLVKGPLRDPNCFTSRVFVQFSRLKTADSNRGSAKFRVFHQKTTPPGDKMPYFTRFRHSTVVVKKMVHRKNETAPNKRPNDYSADISATILLCRIAFALLSVAPPPSHAQRPCSPEESGHPAELHAHLRHRVAARARTHLTRIIKRWSKRQTTKPRRLRMSQGASRTRT